MVPMVVWAVRLFAKQNKRKGRRWRMSFDG
jgi:hypothetical protein